MAPAVKPNIVFVLVDNIGWGDFGCYGGDTPTPRIDELANGGIRFTNYNVESQCAPTRSAILTGRQSVRPLSTRPLTRAGGPAADRQTDSDLATDKTAMCNKRCDIAFTLAFKQGAFTVVEIDIMNAMRRD
jgi:Sulfatase